MTRQERDPPAVRDIGEDALRRLRIFIGSLGLAEQAQRELLATELIHRGCRARHAWRLANGLKQYQVAEEFNRISAARDDEDPGGGMKASRISEFESWPAATATGKKRPRPTVRTLETLAIIFHTSWDRLIDITDLAELPPSDRAAYRAAVARHGSTRPAIPGVPPGEGVPFVGRRQAMETLRRQVDEHLRGGIGVHVISGLAGMGKTALARQVVQEFAAHYPDGVIWRDLHGHDRDRRPGEPAHVLEELLLHLGVKPVMIPADVARYEERWRRETAERRMLIIFDNALDSKQVRPLLPSPRGCFTVVTSRRPLTGLVGARLLQLPKMAPDEAEELLVTLGNLGPEYDTEAAAQILRIADGLPLPIRLLAGQIAHHGPGVLTAIAADFTHQIEQLAGPDPPSGVETANLILDHFAAEGESVRAALDLSYQRLPDERARRAVRLLGWFPGSEVAAEAFAAMVEESVPATNLLLRTIFEGGLLDPVVSRPGEQRYRMHDVPRLYARGMADAMGFPGERAAAVGRLLRHYLGIVRGIGLPRPFDTDRVLPGRSEPNPNASVERARVWLTEHRDTLMACARAAARDAETAEFAHLLAAQLSTLGYWSDSRGMFELACVINRALGDRTAECDALHGLAHALRLACEYDSAAECFESAGVIATQLGDKPRIAATLWGHAAVSRRLGRYGVSQAEVHDVLRIAREVGNPTLMGDALREIGHIERITERYASGHAHYAEAHRIARLIGDRYGEGWSLFGLGSTARLRGESTSARAYFEQALRIGREIYDTFLQVDGLRGLGHIHRAAAETATAQRYYEESMRKARDTDDIQGEADAWRALGKLAGQQGDRERAGEYLENARQLYEGMDVVLYAEVQRMLRKLAGP